MLIRPELLDTSIRQLLDALEAQYGDRIEEYGGVSQYGVGFRIRGVPATFSAITAGGTLPAGRLDVQIESCPPGEYIWTKEIDLAEMIEAVHGVVRGDWG